MAHLLRIHTLLIPFLILAIFGHSGLCYGQSHKLEMGLETGPSRISLRGNEMLKNNHKASVGFSAGLFFQRNLSPHFALRTHLAYERKGSALNAKTLDVLGKPIDRSTSYFNYHYLTLPLLLRATFGQKIRYFGQGGPFLGYLLKQTFTSDLGLNPDQKLDFTYMQKRLDVGISAGFGALIPIRERLHFSVEIRQNLGLFNTSAVPIVGTEPDMIDESASIKTNSTQFLVGLAWQIGKGTGE